MVSRLNHKLNEEFDKFAAIVRLDEAYPHDHSRDT